MRSGRAGRPSSSPAEPKGLIEIAAADASTLLSAFHTSEKGLSKSEARRRLKEHGPNAIASEKKLTWPVRLFRNLKDPLSVLLTALGIVSAVTGDLKTAGLIVVMLAVSVGMRFVQETRADASAEKLQAMVRVTATVLRGGSSHEVQLRSLVPGDIVKLSSGDMIPADVRLISSRDLYVSQASLTGESVPVEKEASVRPSPDTAELDLPNVCFMGTDVVSGFATALVVTTGASTRFGRLASEVVGKREVTSFDKDVNRLTWLMIRFMSVMVPLVFVLNWATKGDLVQSAAFAMAVAIGLTPELLPMIVTVNLSKGAIVMGKRKVIVKRLNAIQNLGAMDILCTDKTGTLTEGRMSLVRHADAEGQDSEKLLDFTCLNSCHETGLKNILDSAVIRHCHDRVGRLCRDYPKLDEIPFDFERRRMSVVVRAPDGAHLLITKGAVEETLSRSTSVEIGGKTVRFAGERVRKARALAERMNEEGQRVIALAYRSMPVAKKAYSAEDEKEMVFLGFLAFLDPAKATAGEAIARLAALGVGVKILTGDNDSVARKICSDVGVGIRGVLSGSEIGAMGDAELAEAADRANLFAKLDPGQKERVIRALQVKGHAVGFLGDGINDAPALRTADVGVSVNTAVDIAKESSDVILLEKSLLVLEDGVREGRRVFGNIDKYVKMAASSNFGNMLSVVGASVFLPFLPMLPLQIVVNNLLYDLSQAAIPTDSVDAEYLVKPRRWSIGSIERFVVFLGPVSSLFDYATFFLMLYVFRAWADPALFHTGWFVESLLTQTLVIHVLRTGKFPFVRSRASVALTATTLAVVAVGVSLTLSPFASALGFVALPAAYWPFLGAMLVGYLLLAQVMKAWVTKRFAAS